MENRDEILIEVGFRVGMEERKERYQECRQILRGILLSKGMKSSTVA